MRFVIIGGDAAGMSAASKAKRNFGDIDVVVLEKTQDVSYSACGMPYNIADPTRNMNDLVVRTAKAFREKQRIDLRLGHTALEINRDQKKVIGAADGKEFEVGYDKLLIATGAGPAPLPVPGADLPGVLMLKNLEDGRQIKRYLSENPIKRALIVGAGYIGLEMTEAFHDLDIEVIVADVREELLPWAPPEMRLLVHEELKAKGVQIALGCEITEIQRLDGRLRVVTQKDPIDVDLVLVGVGVKPNSEIAGAAGLELGPQGSIAVDKALHTSDPDIFSGGDCADAFHIITGRRVWIPLALRANRSGWAVADNLEQDKVFLAGVAGSSVFKVLDLEVARTGLNPREAEEAGFDAVDAVIKSRSRAHGHPGNTDIYVQLVAEKRTGRLLGGSIVGKEGAAHRIDAIAVALMAKMTASEFFQCDMAYAPPFSPVWDPMLTAANQLLKKL
jgi:CoA-dependent NAD(P)H sulfur oxidoreductase